MEGTRRLTPEMLAPRLVCEAFLAISLLVAFVVPFRLYLARRREEQPPTVALAVLARQLWFPASMTVLVAFITLWHWSPQPWLCWGTLPIVASNLASLLLATYLVDTGVRRKQGYYIAAGVLCAARVLYLTCVMLDVDQHRLEVSCVLAAFGLSLSGLAVAWLRLEPARPDTLKLPVRSWEPPRSVERLLASCSTPSAILLLVAFAIQHAAIATNYSVRPLAQPAPAAARVN